MSSIFKPIQLMYRRSEAPFSGKNLTLFCYFPLLNCADDDSSFIFYLPWTPLLCGRTPSPRLPA
ncbi:hypothetical protein SBV1_30052 [Verrucomicrobia bacterium]|nr:hypothetical protein SBV1_30052 [Verrucomicrobiota bacterium]